jgi:superfamily II DNA helicase RecQ
MSCRYRTNAVKVWCLFTDSLPASKNFLVGLHHASLTSATQKRNLIAFLSGHICVMVATICFGLNVPDVQTIIHFGKPHNEAEYWQEVCATSFNCSDTKE